MSTTPTDPTTAGKTPTPDQVEAETRAEFLHLHKAPKDWLIVTESEVASLKSELVAKDAELAAQTGIAANLSASVQRQDREYHDLRTELATLRQQLDDANDAFVGTNAACDHLRAKLTASERANAALRAEVERLLHERNEIAEKSVLPYRDQLNALVREAEKVVVERDAARALNDTLAGALDKYTDQTCASDELETEACAAVAAETQKGVRG